MDKLKSIESFVTVARSGSFSNAANQLGVTRALISKRIAHLEESLGVRLFHRTTRQLSLTVSGREYVDVCSRILAELEEEEKALTQSQKEPKGILRIVSAKSFGTLHMASAVADFVALYPDLRVEMESSASSPTAVQLTERGFDVGIRIIPAPASRVVARKFASFDWVLCAAPKYLKSHGEPRTLSDLAHHRCIVNPRLSPGNVWTFHQRGKEYSEKISPTLSITSVLAIKAPALEGAGLALLPTYCAGEELRDGRLRPVLTSYAIDRGAVYLVYPNARLVSSKVRLFGDFIAKRFRKGF
ncbi:MAG: LysR substrate-binding domain-containing protein [Hyphomicrobium sp.]